MCRDLRLYGALWPHRALDMGVMGCTVATSCLVFLMGAQTLRAPWADCWEPASLEAAFQESACLGAAFLNMAIFWQSAVRPAGHQKAALRLDVLRGVAGPDVLKGSGTRVRLPVAHYSDSSPRSW